MIMEEWRNVPGWEWKYQVSNMGRFAKIIKGKRVLRKSTLYQHGYYYVTLYDGDKKEQAPLHRLLALAFIPKYSSGDVINHIDGNQRNNSLDNLEWCTQRKNCIHRTRTLKHCPKDFGSKKVLCIETGIVYHSVHNAARGIYRKKCDPASTILNGLCSHIRDCCLRKRVTCYGYHWEFV